VRERVVIDGNHITGGGVTAGIDFGLRVLAELRSEPIATATQLMLEYDPAPPFDAGSPEKAGPEITARVMGMLSSDPQQRAWAAVRAVRNSRSE
jgi:cyclohexyl-isocyanide hydratase